MRNTYIPQPRSDPISPLLSSLSSITALFYNPQDFCKLTHMLLEVFIHRLLCCWSVVMQVQSKNGIQLDIGRERVLSGER